MGVLRRKVKIVINIFLIGDSISLDYGEFINDFVDEGINVYGKPGVDEAYENLDIPVAGNGGDSSMILSYINEVKDTMLMDCDYFFFNCGLHDVKHDKETGEIQVGLEDYIKNLHSIIDFMEERNKPVVFINTTPAATERYTPDFDFYRITEDVPVYNEAAEKVMEERNIPLIDLYGFTKALKLEGDDLFRDHTHFRDNVRKLHAAYMAGQINAFVKTMK